MHNIKIDTPYLRSIKEELNNLKEQTQPLIDLKATYEEKENELAKLKEEQEILFNFERDSHIRDLHQTLTHAEINIYKLERKIEELKRATYSKVQGLYPTLCKDCTDNDKMVARYEQLLSDKINELITTFKELTHRKQEIYNEIADEVVKSGYPTLYAIQRYAPNEDSTLLNAIELLEKR